MFQVALATTILAGNGRPSSSGDGGPATSAPLYYPIGVAVDQSENGFILQHYSHCVRKVFKTGTTRTVAGDKKGPIVFRGDGSLAVEPLEVIFTRSKNPLLLVPCVYSDRNLSNASF